MMLFRQFLILRRSRSGRSRRTHSADPGPFLRGLMKMQPEPLSNTEPRLDPHPPSAPRSVTLSRTAGEGAERSEAGEGGAADRVSLLGVHPAAVG